MFFASDAMVNSAAAAKTKGGEPIRAFLLHLGLEKYADKFVEEEIFDEDTARLCLTERDLQHLGLPLGPRRKLQEALRPAEAAAQQPAAQRSKSRLSTNHTQNGEDPTPRSRASTPTPSSRRSTRKRISKTVARAGLNPVACVEAPGEDWIKIASSWASPSTHHTDNGEELDLLYEDRFNVTRTKIEELFGEYDGNHDDYITCQELVDGFGSLDPKVEIDLTVAQGIVNLLPLEMVEDQKINMDGLELILTQLRLGELFQTDKNAEANEHDVMWIVDYCIKSHHVSSLPRISTTSASLSEDRQQQQHVPEIKEINLKTEADHKERVKFFFSSKPFANHIRWVHIDAGEGMDKLNLNRLAVKYHLHPLAVEDVLDPRTGTKLDPFDDHQFLSIDIFSLSQDSPVKSSNKSLDRGDRSPCRPRVHRGNISIFFCCNARIRKREETEDKDESERKTEAEPEMMISILRSASEASSWLTEWKASGGEDPQENDLRKSRFCNGVSALHGEKAKSQGFFKDFLLDLKTGRLRDKSVSFLLYRVLESIVNEMDPIAAAYAKRLGYLKGIPESDLTQENLDELDSTKLELLDMQRSIKPLKVVVNHLMKEKHFKEAGTKIYLEDVVDSIENMILDLQQLHDMTKLVEEAFDGYNDRRMNKTLFALSLITAIFLPAQFITGLYGMNFIDPETGDPGLPELMMKDGYAFFWSLEFAMVGAMLFFVVALHKSCENMNGCCSRRCSRCFSRCRSRNRSDQSPEIETPAAQKQDGGASRVQELVPVSETSSADLVGVQSQTASQVSSDASPCTSPCMAKQASASASTLETV